MWIVCLADNSHEMFLFFLKKKKKKKKNKNKKKKKNNKKQKNPKNKYFNVSPAVIIISTLRFIRFKWQTLISYLRTPLFQKRESLRPSV